MKRFDLIKLSVTEDRELLTGVHRQLRDDLSNEQLRRILGHMNKVTEVVAESVVELESGDITRVDLIKLTLTGEGELLTRVYKQLQNNLGNEQLRKILGYMNKVAEIVAEAITESEEEDEDD